jgi:hypothetical protein
MKQIWVDCDGNWCICIRINRNMLRRISVWYKREISVSS